MSKKWVVPGTIIGVILLIIMTVGGSYNGLVTRREEVNKSLANVQVQYQRRSDLVPNLVNTVKGAASFEQATLTDVVEARAKATSIQIDPSNATPEQLRQYQAAQGELSQALGKLLAITEAYPELQTISAFRDLQAQLEGTENRIAVARKDFNDVAAGFNASVKRFPTVITASVFGFEEYPYFQADQGSDEAPSVNFE